MGGSASKSGNVAALRPEDEQATSSSSDFVLAQLELDSAELFKAWESHEEWGHFFMTFGYSFGRWESEGSLEVGDKIAEGAQAEIFNVHVKWNSPELKDADLEDGVEYVLKVFKHGTSLGDLQSLWDEGFFRYTTNVWQVNELGKPGGIRYICNIRCATLLKDGRFAFLMEKEDGDLQCLIECKMLESDEDGGPFSKEVGEEIMYRVAQGMDALHEYDIVHGNLKASSVYVKHSSCGKYFHCYVADFEGPVGVFGTRFWRAPEILKALWERNIWKRPKLFSKEADSYSYGMTCYEVLTGRVPFQDHPLWGEHCLLKDLVIDQHLRPEVPEYVEDWARELLHKCWKVEVDERPSFKEILDILAANSESEYIRGEVSRRK